LIGSTPGISINAAAVSIRPLVAVAQGTSSRVSAANCSRARERRHRSGATENGIGMPLA